MDSSMNRKGSTFEKDLQYWYRLSFEERKYVLENMNSQEKLVYLSGSPNFLMDIPEDFFKSVKFVRSALILETINDSHDILIDFRTTEDGIRVSASRDLFKTVIWKIFEMGNIMEVIGKYFQIVIRKTTMVERIVIDSALFPFDATSIGHLKNLEDLEINNQCPIDLQECGFIDLEQLCRIKKSIKFNGLPLTMLQLQQLNAERIQLGSMEITSKEINQHLKMYLNNELHNIPYEMELFMSHEFELNIRRLTRGLKLLSRQNLEDGATTFLLISSDNSRIALVYIKNYYLVFLHSFEQIMEAELTVLPDADKVLGWWDLPYEMREMVIERMDDSTKLAFCLCSDDCAADMPRNYANCLDIFDFDICMRISHNKSCIQLDFSQSYDKKTCTIKCPRSSSEVHWKMEEKGKMADIIAKCFRRIVMNIYELEHVYIGMSKFPFGKTTIRQLKKLEHLTIDRVFLIECLEDGFMNPEQLLRVSKSIRFIGIALTLSQLQYLNSGIMLFLYTKISSEDINQFLKLFENGQIHKNFGSMQSSIRISYELNYKKVVEGLSVLAKVVDAPTTRFVIVDTVKLDRVAEIELGRNTFNMRVATKTMFYEKNALGRRSIS